jgi:hypothetical protein
MNGLLTVQIQPAQCPFFCLYGSVDSIQDELWYDVEHRRSKGEATFIDQGWDQNDEDYGEHRKSIILLRLRDFVEAIYAIRCDDGKRYQLLSYPASMDEDMSWKLIIDECPRLKNCDTAYSRVQLTKT